MQVQTKEVKKNLNILLPFHPLTNIEINENYKNEPRFNGVYSRNNLPNKNKKGAYVINLDEYKNTGILYKILIDLSASFGTLSIASYASVVDTPAGIAGSSLTLIFTIGTGISKSLLKVTKKRKKKHNKIIGLAKNKLNTIDTLLSSALNDSEISHEEFSNIITEANIYETIKENIKELTTEPSTKEKLTTL